MVAEAAAETTVAQEARGAETAGAAMVEAVLAGLAVVALDLEAGSVAEAVGSGLAAEAPAADWDWAADWVGTAAQAPAPRSLCWAEHERCTVPTLVHRSSHPRRGASRKAGCSTPQGRRSRSPAATARRRHL